MQVFHCQLFCMYRSLCPHWLILLHSLYTSVITSRCELPAEYTTGQVGTVPKLFVHTTHTHWELQSIHIQSLVANVDDKFIQIPPLPYSRLEVCKNNVFKQYCSCNTALVGGCFCDSSFLVKYFHLSSPSSMISLQLSYDMPKWLLCLLAVC